MTNYRRNRLSGGTYFFTLTLADRRQGLLVKHIDKLKTALYSEQKRLPFAILALVVLPDHLHTIWRLPENDNDYSSRWRRIKSHFSRGLPKLENISESRLKKGERGIWQRRFWEHTIRDENDLRMHMDYIHYNPLKHQYVVTVADWPHSTFHKYVKRGMYSLDWCGGNDTDIIGEIE